MCRDLGVEIVLAEGGGKSEAEGDEVGFLNFEKLNTAARDSSSKPAIGPVVVALPVSLDGMSTPFSSWYISTGHTLHQSFQPPSGEPYTLLRYSGVYTPFSIPSL